MRSIRPPVWACSLPVLHVLHCFGCSLISVCGVVDYIYYSALYNEYKTALQLCVLYCLVVGVYYMFYANYLV